MRKTAVVIAAVMIISVFFLAAAQLVNDGAAKKTADKILTLPLPDNTECIESVYKAGKLTGNGNGMQYFGAVLLKSECSLEELKKYYSDFAENEWEYVVEKQTDTEIKTVENTRLHFKEKVEGDNYYIVYSWGDNDTIFHEFDIRGH